MKDYPIDYEIATPVCAPVRNDSVIGGNYELNLR